MRPSESSFATPDPAPSKLAIVLVAGSVLALIGFIGTVLFQFFVAHKLERLDAAGGHDVKWTVPDGSHFPSIAPNWIPRYPGADPGNDSYEAFAGNLVAGTYGSQTYDPVEKVRDYYERTLRADGFETTSQTTYDNGVTSAVVAASTHGGRPRMIVKVGSALFYVTISIPYEGPMSDPAQYPWHPAN